MSETLPGDGPRLERALVELESAAELWRRTRRAAEEFETALEDERAHVRRLFRALREIRKASGGSSYAELGGQVPSGGRSDAARMADIAGRAIRRYRAEGGDQ